MPCLSFRFDNAAVLRAAGAVFGRVFFLTFLNLLARSSKPSASGGEEMDSPVYSSKHAVWVGTCKALMFNNSGGRRASHHQVF